MPRRVLNVGHCGVDHARIRRLIRRHFDADVEEAADAQRALGLLAEGRFDLVLVNRKLEADGSDGVSLITSIKSDAALAATPVMLVSNYPDAQDDAATAGAEPGFGKAALRSDETRRRLARFLD